MGPIWVPCGQNSPTMWVPYGLPIWCPDGPTWGPDAPYGTHIPFAPWAPSGPHLGMWVSCGLHVGCGTKGPYRAQMNHLVPRWFIWESSGSQMVHLGIIWVPDEKINIILSLLYKHYARYPIIIIDPI